MFSPGTLPQTRQQRATLIIRIAVEKKGLIGFIEAQEHLKLQDARKLINETVDDAPDAFHFVLEDGVPVSMRQEPSQNIVDFYPTLTLRAISQPNTNEDGTSVENVDQYQYVLGSGVRDGERIRVSVWNRGGEECKIWVTPEYTFQQLRRDAARYWDFSSNNTTLADADGCLWPEQARILACMNSIELQQHKIILEANEERRHSTPRVRRRQGDNAISSKIRQALCKQAELLTPVDGSARMNQPLNELWLIFTFYCVGGDSLEVESITARHFLKLLRDCHVLGGATTPAIAQITYTSKTKNKSQASGRMSFDEFLNALVQLASIRLGGSTRKQIDAKQQEEFFLRLVTEQVLPKAARWPSQQWQHQTDTLRTPDVIAFLAKLIEPLLAIFMFYAKSHIISDDCGSKTFFMAYCDYQRFVTDFGLASLQISSLAAAQVFLASCLSPPVHDTFLSARAELSNATKSPQLSSLHEKEAFSTSASDENIFAAAETVSESSSIAEGTVAFAYHRVLSDADGVVLFTPATAQVGRVCMSFSAFIDALGRLGIVTFTNVKPLPAVKAVFHHLARTLTRSRVHSILGNHGNASIHASRFYSGAVAFSTRFLEVWRKDGSLDYLTSLEQPQAPSLRPHNHDETNAPSSPAALSPSRRLISSAALFDERVITNGAGKGREALDRLTREAFIRNATITNNANSIQSDAKSLSAPTTDVSTIKATSAAPLPNMSNSKKSGSKSDAGLGISIDIESFLEEPNISGPPEPQLSPTSVAAQDAAVAPLPSPSPMCDEHTLFSSVLVHGDVFKHYGHWGTPRRRFVWCPESLDAIYFRQLTRTTTSTNDRIAMSSLLEIVPGSSTRARCVFLKHLSDDKQRQDTRGSDSTYRRSSSCASTIQSGLSRCFSLVTADRRVDLEAESDTTQDLWVRALSYMLAHQLRKAEIPSA